MATWQLLLAVWAIGIPGVLLAPALLPPRRSVQAHVLPDDVEPTAVASVVHCRQLPRRALRANCVRPLPGSRQTRRAAAP
jgi:hypothetical protein